MILYSENGEKINFDLTTARLIKNGERGFYSDVYHYGSNCLKMFRMSRVCDDAVMRAIRNIKCDNLYKILDLYYSSVLRRNDDFVAYSSFYYEDCDINILNMPMDYFLDNFSDLRKLAIILGNAGIEMDDLHDENIIFQKNRMIMIDADQYKLHYDLNNSILDYIKSDNIVSIRLLMGAILRRDIAHNLNFKDFDRNNIIKILALFFHNDDYSIDDIFHELSYYKYPVEFIKKKSSH